MSTTAPIDYEYFLHVFGNEVRVARGIPTEHGHRDTAQVAVFFTDEMSFDVALNHAYAVLSLFQRQGHKVRWPL